MKTHKYVGWVLSVAMLTMTSVASISTNYGDFTAASVDFIQVTESTINTGAGFPMYNAPIVSASSDTMDFNPVGFSAQASNGDSDLTDGNLVFDVVSRQDQNTVIDQIGFAERGVFSLGGTGTVATYADVTAAFYVEITEVNYAPIETIGIWAQMEFLTNSNGTYQLGVDASSGIWSGSVLVDLNNELAIRGYDENQHATRVSVDLNNWLSVYTEAGTSAMIAKKDFDTNLTITVIPEPATLGMIGFSTTLGLLYRRRKGFSILGDAVFLRDPAEQSTVSDADYVNPIKRLLSSKELARAQWLNF